MSFETLLFILVLAAIAFVNVVLPWLRRRAERTRRGEPEPEREPAEEANEDARVATRARPRHAPAAWPVGNTEGPGRATEPAAAHGMPVADRRVRHALLTSLADARRGMVLRAILGPCRAQEPFDGSVN